MQGIAKIISSFGLEKFWNEANLPQKLLKKLRLNVERDPFRMPLALTLQRKNQKALHLVSASRRTNKMIWYERTPLQNITPE